jgi:hypothetical protein
LYALAEDTDDLVIADHHCDLRFRPHRLHQ